MIRLDSERMDHRFRLAVDVVVAMVAAVLLRLRGGRRDI